MHLKSHSALADPAFAKSGSSPMEDYLTLHRLRLAPGEVWSANQEGLVFLFSIDGVGRHIVGEAARQLGRGDALVANGQRLGDISAANGGDWVVWVFSLRLEQLYPVLDGNMLSGLQTVRERLQTSRRFAANNPVALRSHSLLAEIPAEFNLDHRLRLLQVAATMLSDEFHSVAEQAVGSVGFRVLEVFKNIPLDQLLNLPVGELAVKFGCSRRHLNRLFRQCFGSSVAALRMELRLLRAVTFVRDTNNKISQVAEQCGCHHLGLFNSCFKRRFGLTPGQWRKQALLVSASLPGPGQPGQSCPFHMKGVCPVAPQSGQALDSAGGLAPRKSAFARAWTKEPAASMPQPIPVFIQNKRGQRLTPSL